MLGLLVLEGTVLEEGCSEGTKEGSVEGHGDGYNVVGCNEGG